MALGHRSIVLFSLLAVVCNFLSFFSWESHRGHLHLYQMGSVVFNCLSIVLLMAGAVCGDRCFGVCSWAKNHFPAALCSCLSCLLWVLGLLSLCFGAKQEPGPNQDHTTTSFVEEVLIYVLTGIFLFVTCCCFFCCGTEFEESSKSKGVENPVMW